MHTFEADNPTSNIWFVGIISLINISTQKMTKEELLTALQGKLGTNSNLSNRTLETYAEQMASAMGENFSISDEFVDNQTNILKSIGGQLSHDISVGIEDWKKSNPTTTTTTTTQGGNKLQPQSGEPSEYAKLLEKLNSLEERLDGEASAKKLTEYKSKLTNALKAKLGKDSNDYIISNVVNSTELNVEKDIDSILGDIEQSYNAEYKKCFGNAAKPANPQPGGTSGRTDEQNSRLNSFKDRMRSRGLLPNETTKS